MESPYITGSSLRLRLLEGSEILSVKVQHVYEPFSMAAVMRVELETEPSFRTGFSKGSAVILKVYDRRFATSLRNWHRAGPYDETLAKQYLQDLIVNPTAEEEDEEEVDQEEIEHATDRALVEVQDNEDEKGDEGGGPEREAEEKGDDEDSEQDETPVEKLRIIQKRCLDLASAEQGVYAQLKPLQDTGRIPTYFSAAELIVDAASAIPDDLSEAAATFVTIYLRIPAALMSVVDGVLLRDIQQVIPQMDWKKAIAAATSITNEIGKYHVLNDDVRPDNVFVQQRPRAAEDVFRDESEFEYNAIAFDFAQARLRRDDESDQEWKEHKWMVDEEGAIGVVMYHQLGLGEFEKTEEGSLRYRVLAEDMKYY